jgi:hypothetical protein
MQQSNNSLEDDHSFQIYIFRPPDKKCPPVQGYGSRTHWNGGGFGCLFAVRFFFFSGGQNDEFFLFINQCLRSSPQRPRIPRNYSTGATAKVCVPSQEKNKSLTFQQKKSKQKTLIPNKHVALEGMDCLDPFSNLFALLAPIRESL